MTINQVRLDFEDRQSADVLADEVEYEPIHAAFELIALRKVLRLASELCTAVDNLDKDIGGSRHIKEILGELGPACDAAEGR